MKQIMEIVKTIFGISAVDSLVSGVKSVAPKFAEEMVENLKKSLADRKAAEAMKKVIYLILQGLTDDIAKANIMRRYQWRQERSHGHLPGDEDRLTVVLYSLYMASPTQFEIMLIDLGRMTDDVFNTQIEILYPDYAYQKIIRFLGQADQGIGNAIGQVAAMFENSGIHANAGAPVIDTGSITMNQLLGIFRAVIDTGDRWVYWLLFGFFGWFLITLVAVVIANAMGNMTLVPYTSFTFILISSGALVAGFTRPLTVSFITNEMFDKAMTRVGIAIGGQLMLTLLFTAVPMGAPWIICLMISLFATLLFQNAKLKGPRTIAFVVFLSIIAISAVGAYGSYIDSATGKVGKFFQASSKKNSEEVVRYSGSKSVSITATDDWGPWYELPAGDFGYSFYQPMDVQFRGGQPIHLTPGSANIMGVVASNQVRVRGSGMITFSF